MRRPLLALIVLLGGAPSLASDAVLDNGLRVILIPHRANPMVAIATVVGAGVVHEPPEASGASHFLEHLLFNGTTTRSQRELYDDVDRLGAYNNATTREDHTLFTLLVAKEHAEEGLAIQADMLFHSTLPAESFDKERKIVLEELARDRADPSYDVESAFRASAFAGTPIARPVLGTEASLGAITRDQVASYYKARYVPSNMTLVVMGDFDLPAMDAAVRRTFGAAPKRAAPRADAARWPPPPASNVESDAGASPARLLAAYPVDVAPWDGAALAMSVLLAAASEGADAPLARALERRSVAAGGTSLTLDSRTRPWSTVTLDVTLERNADPAAILDALAEAIASTRPGGEARERVERVRARLAGDAAIARDQIHYFAMLRGSAIPGSPKGWLEGDAASLSGLGAADWDAAAERLSAGLASVRARIAGPERAKSRSAWAPPAGAPATGARADLRAGALANGLRYVVRESADSGVFAAHVAFAPRSAAEPAGLAGITDVLHRMMTRGYEDRRDAIGARIRAVDDPSVPFDDYYTTPEFSWIRLEVESSRWREALGLVAEMVRRPALTAGALEDARRGARERAATRDASPRETATARLDALLAPGHPAASLVYGTAASLDAVTLDAVTAYRAALASGRRMVVTAVGPVSAEAVVRALDAELGSLPEGEPPRPPAPAAIAERPGSAEVTLGKSQAYLALGELLDAPPEDRAALAVAASMLSDRLAFDLRETRGLAYTIGASVRPWAGRMRLDIAMGTRAENLEAARTGILDGLAAFRDAEPTAADVARAVNAARGAALMRRMTRISLAYESGLEAIRGREPGDERRFVDSFARVTPEDVRRVARTYFLPDRLATVVVR